MIPPILPGLDDKVKTASISSLSSAGLYLLTPPSCQWDEPEVSGCGWSLHRVGPASVVRAWLEDQREAVPGLFPPKGVLGRAALGEGRGEWVQDPSTLEHPCVSALGTGLVSGPHS